MKQMRQTMGVFLLCCISLYSPMLVSAAESISKAPTNIQVALFVKLLATHKGISSGKKVHIRVIGHPKFASAMKSVVGRKLGGATLEAVEEKALPEGKEEGLAAIYVGDLKQWDTIKAYCRKHKVLSISGQPELVGKGVTLLVGIDKKKPKVILDMKASKEEGANWDTKILKIATLINK